MNTVQAALKREIEQEVSHRGGFDLYRAHALRHLQLKTVVRESHPSIQLAFNHVGTGNLVATVGADQATVYDDVHMGDHIGVVVHFTNTRTEHHKGGALRAAAWINCQGLTCHPADDAWLAVAGSDHVVQVLSVAESRVIRQLTGHTCEVVDLCGPRQAAGLLLSMSQDGCVRLWDVPAAACLACIHTDAHTAALHGSGGYFLTGHAHGRVCRWDLTSTLAHARTNAAGGQAQGPSSGDPTPQCTSEAVFTVDPDQHAVDCIRFITEDCVAAKTCGGRVGVWCLARQGMGQQLWSAHIPGGETSGAYPSRCVMDSCTDGAYLCCGNTTGSVYVYDCHTGAQVCQAAADKVQAPVRACGLSQDCRHLWASLGNGFIFRFEYIAPDRGVGDGVDYTGLIPQQLGEEQQPGYIDRPPNQTK